MRRGSIKPTDLLFYVIYLLINSSTKKKELIVNLRGLDLRTFFSLNIIDFMLIAKMLYFVIDHFFLILLRNTWF